MENLAKALVAAQSEVENSSKSSTNPHFKSKYSDLAEVLNTVRPVFTKHGISIVQSPSFSDGMVHVTTYLIHVSGEQLSGTISIPVAKQDAQAIGSAITYARRYSLASFCGIAQEDDDGNAAIEKPVTQNLDAAFVKKFKAAKSLDELSDAWNSIEIGSRKLYATLKDEEKERLTNA